MIGVIQNITDELYRIFNILNEEKFNNELPEPVITLQYTKGTYGHFVPSKIWKNKDDDTTDEECAYYEININPSYFNVREPEDIVGTLLHEMVHYCNTVHNITDCSGKRHNKKFKILAEKIGLVVEETNYGWSSTACSYGLKEFIENVVKPNKTIFGYFRYTLEQPRKKKKRKKNTFRYTCPSCGMEMKGKANNKVLCGVCKQLLEMEEPEDENDAENGG